VSFGIYLFGIILVIAGLAYGAAMLHVPTDWIVMLSLVMLGIGVVTAVKATRQRDPAK
jgi:cadmium resistance protein CadD (predicted permease)